MVLNRYALRCIHRRFIGGCLEGIVKVMLPLTQSYIGPSQRRTFMILISSTVGVFGVNFREGRLAEARKRIRFGPQPCWTYLPNKRDQYPSPLRPFVRERALCSRVRASGDIGRDG